MPAPDLRNVRNFTALIRYLEDELGWPLDGYEMEDLTFDYEPADLGLKEEEAAKVKSIRQLRPLTSSQPWGIFFIEFDKKKLPVVVLRRILSHLVVKKRASANKADRAVWNAEDLLFVSAFGPEDEDGREIGFAHFHQESGDLPSLRVLGWDGADTTMKLNTVAATLRERLSWPEKGEKLDVWQQRWAGAFKHRIGHIIRTSDMLAEAMAALAKRIRDAATTIMQHETERGPLTKLHRAFQTNLIHDLTPEGFADTYAQTITYGLLTAAISRTEMSEGRKGTALVASNISDMVPVTNPFLKEMLQTFLHAGGRKGGIDFDELGVQDVVELLRGEETDLPAILRDFGNKTRGDDPVIHFYEHFLNAYNKALRIQRGVFYTPQPVVSYIVRSVDELLKTEFGLEHGLADTITWGEFIQKSKINNPQSEIKLPPLTDEPGCTETISPDEFFVQILDPATGTATFPVEVIDVIFNYLKDLWKKRGAAAMPKIKNQQSSIGNHQSDFTSYWNAYVPKCLLPRLHAFELMMAPYAIAHMKIGLKLAETGYKFATEERARIYLTNALEPWQKQLPLIGFDALAHEAAAVNEIKRHKRFTVVIGNPPYSVYSSNQSEWIQQLMDGYKQIDGVRIQEKRIAPLMDDYCKFFRLSQHLVSQSGFGVVGIIANHNWLTGIVFRGMRKSFLDNFYSTILDLHGNSIRNDSGECDENVFDIRVGTAICISVADSSRSQARSNFLSHADLRGDRESKYSFLSKSTISSINFQQISPASDAFYFTPQISEDSDKDWSHFLPLENVFKIGTLGMMTGNDEISISETYEEANQRIVDMTSSLSDAEIREKYDLTDNTNWKLADAKRVKMDKELITKVSYRPFDIRYTYFSKLTLARPQFQVNQPLIDIKNNLALCLPRQLSKLPYCHVLVTRHPTEMCFVSNRTKEQNRIFPLYAGNPKKAAQGTFLNMEKTETNFSPNFALQLANDFKDSHSDASKSLTPEDIFHYIYAVFHSPGYRSRYAEFLKIDFPRLPLTGNLELFRALARLGGELTALHLLESPKLDKPITQFIGGSKEVTRIGWSDNTVWIDAPAKKKDMAQAPGSSGFKGVPEAVWNFHIGGYQVCEKWLKDRKGRTLTDEDIAHYHKIVIALTETIRLMAEIDEVISQHGGWPGAFQSAQS